MVRSGRKIIDGISFESSAGITGLLGKNGAGKTTFIKALCGIGEGVSGSVSVFDGETEIKRSKERAKYVAYVPQEGGAPEQITASEFVLLGRSPYLKMLALPGKSDRLFASEAMKKFGVEHLSNRIFSTLSGGEKKLCRLARAAAGNAEIALLDEPLAGLDFEKKHRLFELLETGIFRSVLVSLHSPDMAYRRCNRIIAIDGGKILADIDMKSEASDEEYLAVLKKIYGNSVAFSESGEKNIIWRNSNA